MKHLTLALTVTSVLLLPPRLTHAQTTSAGQWWCRPGASVPLQVEGLIEGETSPRPVDAGVLLGQQTGARRILGVRIRQSGPQVPGLEINYLCHRAVLGDDTVREGRNCGEFSPNITFLHGLEVILGGENRGRFRAQVGCYIAGLNTTNMQYGTETSGPNPSSGFCGWRGDGGRFLLGVTVTVTSRGC